MKRRVAEGRVILHLGIAEPVAGSGIVGEEGRHLFRELQILGDNNDRRRIQAFGSIGRGHMPRDARLCAVACAKDETILKEVLKQEIRIRGLRYQDIADQLGVSVVTIKRYLNSDRLPVEVMEDISACLGLSLIDLSEIGKEGDGRNFLDLELRQESALASDSALALMRLMLYSGMTAPEITSEYAVDEATVISLLTRLDRLKLIELLPGNRVRIPGPHHIEWKPGGPIRRTIKHNIRNHFFTMDSANTEDYYGYETVRLSRASVRQLEEHMRQLVRQVRVLHRLDQGIPSADKQWHMLLVAQRETNWGFPVDNGETLLPRRPTGPTFPAVAEPPAV